MPLHLFLAGFAIQASLPPLCQLLKSNRNLQGAIVIIPPFWLPFLHFLWITWQKLWKTRTFCGKLLRIPLPVAPAVITKYRAYSRCAPPFGGTGACAMKLPLDTPRSPQKRIRRRIHRTQQPYPIYMGNLKPISPDIGEENIRPQLHSPYY